MGRDKKALDGLTFVLDGPAGVEVVAGVPEAAARSALAPGRRGVIPEIRTERLLLRGWTRRRSPGDGRDQRRSGRDGDDRSVAVDRAESDADIDRMIAHWAEHGFGLWCVDLDGTCIGFTGLADARVHARRRGRAGGSHPPSGATATRRRPGGRRWRFGFGELGLDEIVVLHRRHQRQVAPRRWRSWAWSTTRPPTSTIRGPSPSSAAHVLYRLPFASWSPPARRLLIRGFRCGGSPQQTLDRQRTLGWEGRTVSGRGR